MSGGRFVSPARTMDVRASAPGPRRRRLDDANDSPPISKRLSYGDFRHIGVSGPQWRPRCIPRRRAPGAHPSPDPPVPTCSEAPQAPDPPSSPLSPTRVPRLPVLASIVGTREKQCSSGIGDSKVSGKMGPARRATDRARPLSRLPSSSNLSSVARVSGLSVHPARVRQKATSGVRTQGSIHFEGENSAERALPERAFGAAGFGHPDLRNFVEVATFQTATGHPVESRARSAPVLLSSANGQTTFDATAGCSLLHPECPARNRGTQD